MPAQRFAASSTEGASALHTLQPGAQNHNTTGVPDNVPASNSPPPTSGAFQLSASTRVAVVPFVAPAGELAAGEPAAGDGALGDVAEAAAGAGAGAGAALVPVGAAVPPPSPHPLSARVAAPRMINEVRRPDRRIVTGYNGRPSPNLTGR